MYILPNTKIETIEQKGTEEQKATAVYFDRNGNGKIDRNEADSFNFSKITRTENKIKIQNLNGHVDTFENVEIRKPNEYYKNGTIPIAVVDTFHKDCTNNFHGPAVCNILKQKNKNLSITEIDYAPQRCWNKFQNGFAKFADKHIKVSEFLEKHHLFPNFILNKKAQKPLFEAFEEIKTRMNNGEKFKAVNLSSSIGITYEEINKLVEKEIGKPITPNNIKYHSNKIREILEKNENKKITSENGKVKIKTYLELIRLMESINIPIYMAGEYKTGENKDIEQFNILGLAKNSLIVEGGIEQPDGTITHSLNVSHNSLALDQNGKRRIEDSFVYSGSELCRGSTSYATPMALAKAFLSN